MRVAVLKESLPGEKRVALVPAEIARLSRRQLQVDIQTDAGHAAGYADALYEAKGAHIVHDRAELLKTAEVVLVVRKPDTAGLMDLHEGQTIIGFLDPLGDLKGLAELASRGVTAYAMELMPRITRAQSMDALSSMANIAGYKGVLLAASHLSRMFPMMMTAAGTVSPAKVLVLGAGVAGLQAIATARRLGAVVEAYDVRPEVREQIQSVGGKFIELALPQKMAGDSSGYAQAQSQEFYKHQQAQLATHVRNADVIITTAAVPGRRAPILITAEMLHGAKPGCVLVDLAAETGGNCSVTRPGETMLWEGITILGPLNLPSTVAFHASQLYARNVSTFLEHLCSAEGSLAWDSDDDITKATMVLRDGNVVHERVRTALSKAA